MVKGHSNSERKEGRKEGNVLFKDALKAFYLRLYGVRYIVKNHSDSERGNSEMNPTTASQLAIIFNTHTHTHNNNNYNNNNNK